MNLLFFQVRLFTVRVRLKLRASVALSPVFSTALDGCQSRDDRAAARTVRAANPLGELPHVSSLYNIYYY